MLKPGDEEKRKALTRRLKTGSGVNPIMPPSRKSSRTAKRLFPNLPKSSDKPFFNPKAQIDSSQVEDRGPTADDIRERFINKGKKSQQVRRLFGSRF